MKQRYERKGATIKDLENNTSKTYPSITEAKRASRKLQQAKGRLGQGYLRLRR